MWPPAYGTRWLMAPPSCHSLGGQEGAEARYRSLPPPHDPDANSKRSSVPPPLPPPAIRVEVAPVRRPSVSTVPPGTCPATDD